MSAIARKKSGYTIVELLIVIVVIAILATISVVAYNGIQNRAHDTAVQSDLKGIATKIEMHKAVHGAYPESGDFSGLKLKATKSAYHTDEGIHQTPRPPIYNLLYCKTADATRFALVARSKSSNTFQYANGSVGEYLGAILTSAVTLCDEVSITGTGNSDRVWLYYNSAWQTWVDS